MSKFNESNVGKNTTVNASGHKAYAMKDKERLVSAVLTTMLGEPKFYGSTDGDIVRLATECAHNDPEFLSKLTCYARNVANLRSVSHVLTCIVAREAHEYTRETIRNVIVRPDDVLEIMACYKTMYGKPFPNAMKREIASVMQGFSEYQLAKYNGGNKDMKFRDVLRITHPTPASKEVEELFNKVLNDTLETPYTWETELSAKGNTKEVWDELIASGKVGYMALLRNMANIIKSGSDIKPVLSIISDPNKARNSKQLPFRFYAAYKKLLENGVMSSEIRQALESALCASVDNMPQLKGRTLIAVDVSGSMQSRISKRNETSCADVAKLLGCMASRMCEDATVAYFSYSAPVWGYNRRAANNSDVMTATGCRGLDIRHYGKFDSILKAMEGTPGAGGGTDMSLPMRWALTCDSSDKPFDRVIFLSDNECNCGKETVQSYADKYREKFNKNLWVHAVDMQGYGTQQFVGKNFNLIAGWSDSVFQFIDLAENGMGSLVQAISEYKLVK